MINPRGKTSLARLAGKFAFALALLLLAGRVTQLARAPIESKERGAWSGESLSQADAQLAQLYAHCPMAATVDLKTIAKSPNHAGALLPPHRQTADRIVASPPLASPQLEPALPRIRYPVVVRSDTSAAPPTADVVRIASLPKDPPPAASTANDWLIDPAEWYTPEERTRLEQGTPSVPSPATPAAAIPPDSDQSPVSNSWQLMTPDDLRELSPEPPSSENQPSPIEPPSRSTLPIEPSPTAAPLAAPDLRLPANESAESTELPPPQTESAPDPSDPPVPIETPVESEPQPPAIADQFSAPPQLAPAEITPPAELIPPPQPALASNAPNNCVDPHLELFAKNAYPSARECAACHEDVYHEWSVSAHAYAAVSPMFHKFEQKLNDLSQGTVGYFCMRCHAPVATALGASRAEPLWNLPEVAREGITCIACHRVQYAYGKSNGERRIEEGSVFAPVFGGIGGEGVADAIHRREHFKVKTSPDEPGPGQDMHAAGIFFEPLTKSEFCTPCHQVQVHPGIKLEVVWEQYRASPACKKGIQCQDCHMGRVPGLPLGYNIGPVAKLADKTVNDHRKRSNHVFYGPNYSIAHPGIFPFHLKANRWTMQQWLVFDWRAGWGTDEFEDRVADGQIAAIFPPCWSEADDRYDAREIIDENLKKLHYKRDIREQVMENGSHVEGPFFDTQPCRGQDVRFHFIFTNTNEGHNLLTASLGAQPQLWANVVLIGPDGRRLWETGYTDSFGDLANIHSHDVRHKKIPYDWQLFNLQSMFLITGAKGTDREFYVPVNVDIDQLPFIRPGVQPISVINHPPFIRMESQSLAPLGSRRVPYRIPGELIHQPGTYRLAFRMRNRAEPIYLMQYCGATEEMQRAMNEGIIDVHPISVEFTIP